MCATVDKYKWWSKDIRLMPRNLNSGLNYLQSDLNKSFNMNMFYCKIESYKSLSWSVMRYDSTFPSFSVATDRGTGTEAFGCDHV